MNTKTKLTVTIDAAAKHKSSRKLCDFLFEKCGSDISEDAVLGYLRRLGEMHAHYPHTKELTSEALLKAIDAVGK